MGLKIAGAGRVRLLELALLSGWLTFGPFAAQAQESAPPFTPPATAPLEERIAAARSVRIMTSILEVSLGLTLDQAHEHLDPLCLPGTRPKDGDAEESPAGTDTRSEEGGKRESEGDAAAPKEERPKPGKDHDAEGHKVLWQLAGTDYSALFVVADEHERITSITGILRAGKELPFDQVGDVSKAPIKAADSVVWDVLRPGHPLFRVIAKGRAGLASSVMIFVVRRKSGEVIRYEGVSEEASPK